MSESAFEKRGGYVVTKEPYYPFGVDIKYMDCKRCGTPVRNVGEDSKHVVCSRCTMGMMVKMFPESATFNPKPAYKPTGRPAGWHWMSEFVDKDGNVFHKGKEQPKLKGTLPPTKVKPKKKTKRRSRDEILVAKYKEKQKIKKAVKKQQDFLNHKTEDK
tara:strand:+ start:307 stop:783 length:477 start_codon:yes stop_codon:yes gene_type:complete